MPYNSEGRYLGNSHIFEACLDAWHPAMEFMEVNSVLYSYRLNVVDLNDSGLEKVTCNDH